MEITRARGTLLGEVLLVRGTGYDLNEGAKGSVRVRVFEGCSGNVRWSWVEGCSGNVRRS